MIEHIPELIDAGIDSLKIEGRMKTALYVATVARTYRRALDDYRQDPKLYEKKYAMVSGSDIQLHLPTVYNRIFFGKPDENTQIYDSNTYVKRIYISWDCWRSKDGLCRIEQRNKFSVGETIEIMKPDGSDIEVVVRRILNEEGEEQESARRIRSRCCISIWEGERQKNMIFETGGKKKNKTSKI